MVVAAAVAILFAVGVVVLLLVTAAAIKLCKRAATPCCIACHSSTRLAWHQRSSSFPAEFYIKPELHQETDAFGMAYGKDGGKSRPKREAADRWISGRDVWGKTVETQSLKLPDGTVLTMIALVK